MYTFAEIKPSPKITDETAWYLEVERGNTDLLFTAWESATRKMFFQFGIDPHNRDPKNPNSYFYNIPRLGAGWMQTAERALAKNPAIYVNSRGGMIFGNVDVVRKVQVERLAYPTKDKTAVVTIQKWAAGQHYYLTGPHQLVFPKDKYDTYEEAYQDALLFAEPENIKSTTRHGYLRPGD